MTDDDFIGITRATASDGRIVGHVVYEEPPSDSGLDAVGYFVPIDQ